MSWEETSLAQVLASRDDGDTQAILTELRRRLPEIEGILASAGTSPSSFSLHDHRHSFRVAERMAEVIGQDVLVALSAPELALLLLSAYLHDIGMTPEQERVSRHYRYLVSRHTGLTGVLSEPERLRFESWLDDSAEKDPSQDTRAPEELDHLVTRASYLVAHYCRYEHVRWGEEWLRANLSDLGIYNGAIDTLSRLCASHHDPLDELYGHDFDPIMVEGGSVVHVRYLAAVLRIADILENDPERTPDVILRHREVAPDSAIFWWRDHEMVTKIHENGSIHISARPKSARVHHAILDIVDSINTELRGCYILAQMTHFETAPGWPSMLAHSWRLPPAAVLDIRPAPGTYEYIVGGIRPNLPRLLDLLSGTALYGTNLAAVRELVLNAFDAVVEAMSWTQVHTPDLKEPPARDSLLPQHHVRLDFERREDGYWLICRDTGVGMDRVTIRDHFLVSGAPRPRRLRDLAAKCQSRGLRYERSGEFGIGSMSYFMLADRVKIRTQGRQEAGLYDGSGWTFEIDGLWDFGELRTCGDAQFGTEVGLRLQPGVDGGDAAAWFDEVTAFLERVIAFCPCSLEIASHLGEVRRITLGPGWTRGRERAWHATRDALRQEWDRSAEREDESEIVPRRIEERRLESQSALEAMLSHAEEAFVEEELEHGELPEGLGDYRITLTSFDLAGGRSLACLITDQETDELRVNAIRLGRAALVVLRGRISWHGIYSATMPWFALHLAQGDCGIGIDINFVSPRAGQSRAARDAFALTEEAVAAVAAVERRAASLLSEWLMRNQSSAFRDLNERLSRTPHSAKKDPEWLETRDAEDGELIAHWRGFQYPVTTALAFAYQLPVKVQQPSGRQLTVLECLGRPRSKDPWRGVTWNSTADAADRVWRLRGGSVWAIPVWTGEGIGQSSELGSLSQFPVSWSDVVAVRWARLVGEDFGDPWTVWNRDHPLIKLGAGDVGEGETRLDAILRRGADLPDDAHGAAIVLLAALRSRRLLAWEALCERAPEEAVALWDASGTGERMLVLWEDFPHSLVYAVSRSGVERLVGAAAEAVIPSVGTDETAQVISPRQTGAFSGRIVG